MEWQLQFLLEFIQLSNNRSLTEYWNFCLTEFSKYVYACALIF